jgi:hypothetical protein
VEGDLMGKVLKFPDRNADKMDDHLAARAERIRQATERINKLMQALKRASEEST